jgi:hypothetical protein
MSEAYTNRVEVGLSRVWMRDNPELAVNSILKFFNDYPLEQWVLAIKKDYMPGMHIMLVAKRR